MSRVIRGEMLEIYAILAVRNEVRYLEHLFPYLTNQNIIPFVIDQDSTDGSRELYAEFNIDWVHVDYSGVFVWESLLNFKEAVRQKMPRNCWVIHHDADEILSDQSGWGGLRAAIEEADMSGYNVLNFEEIVVLPDSDLEGSNFIDHQRYYYHAPKPLRLMRAFRNEIGIGSNVSSGGHVVKGAISVAPTTMILRHYICRSQAHILEKYSDRIFSHEEVAKGWHNNRVGIRRHDLLIPFNSPWLRKLPYPFDVDTVLERPVSAHFWQWPKGMR